MSCWEILGIEPDADKKAIKIAYSKLLKTTRPDEDPEGFNRLHSAYKTALDAVTNPKSPSLARSKPANFDTAPVDADQTSSSTSFVSPTAIEPQASNDHRDELNDEFEQEWYRFAALVNQIMDEQHTTNQTDTWDAALKSPLLTDLRQKQRAGDYVFDAISSKNVLSLNDDKLYVESDTLNRLNTYFSWGANWAQLSEKFSQERLDAVLPYLAAEEIPAAPKEARPHVVSTLTTYITSLLAIGAGFLNLNLFIVVSLLAIPATINRVYTRKWQAKHYGRVVGAEDETIEKSNFILYPILFIAMWILLLIMYGIGWAVGYFFG